jgi:hypothetical protein
VAHDVFISHAHHDKVVADAVCHRMEQAGIRCWIAPRDVSVGMEWDDAVAKAVAESRIVVLVFSAAANNSRNVRNEIVAAADANAIVFPFRIENVAPSGGMQLHLGRVHWLDALSPPIDAHIDLLVENAKRVLGTGEAVVPLEPSPAPPPIPSPSPAPAKAVNRSAIIGFVAGAGILAAVLAVFILSHQRGTPSTERAAPNSLPPTVAVAPPPVTPPTPTQTTVPTAPPTPPPAPTPAPTATVTPPPAAILPPPSGQYVLADSDRRRLDPSELSSLSCAQLGIARNEIYARHGHIFARADLREYFSRLPWYRPSSPESEMTPLERDNVASIVSAETGGHCR